MTATPDDLSLSGVRRVDAVCTTFEAACQGDAQPRIEDFLDATDPAERAALLRELILLDVFYRRQRGAVPLC